MQDKILLGMLMEKPETGYNIKKKMELSGARNDDDEAETWNAAYARVNWKVKYYLADFADF